MAPHHHVNFYRVIHEETSTLLKVKQLGGFAPGSNPGLRPHCVLHASLIFPQKVGILLNAKLQRMSTLRKQEKKAEKKGETFLGSVESS